MWFKSKPTKTEPETVMCATCGHIIAFGRACSVYANGNREYYCEEHRKFYDEDWRTYPSSHRYYKRMEVDRYGTPLGYIEKPKDNVYQGYEKVPK